MKRALFFAISMLHLLFAHSQDVLKKYPIMFGSFNSEIFVVEDKYYTKEMLQKITADNPLVTPQKLEIIYAHAGIKALPEGVNTLETVTTRDWVNHFGLKQPYVIGRYFEMMPEKKYFRQLMLVWFPIDLIKYGQDKYKLNNEEGFYLIYVVTPHIMAGNLPNGDFKPEIAAAIHQKLSSKNLKEDGTDIAFEITLNYGPNMGIFYKTLSQDYGFTEEELKMISYKSDSKVWPDSLQNAFNFKKIAHLKKYILGEEEYESEKFTLYWIPANQNFSKGFQPPKEGLFVCKKVYVNNNREIPGKPMLEGTLASYDRKKIQSENIKNQTASKTVEPTNKVVLQSQNVGGISIQTVSEEMFEQIMRGRDAMTGGGSGSSGPYNTYYFYGERQKTTLTTSDNTQYQIKYIIVKGPAGLSERDIVGRFGRKFSAFGMKTDATEFFQCADASCGAVLQTVRGRYSNLTVWSIGEFNY